MSRSFSKSISSRCHCYKLSTFLIDEVIRYWYNNSILIIVAFRCFSTLLALFMLSTCIWIRLIMMMICIGWSRWWKICQSLERVIFVAYVSGFIKFFICSIVIFVATVIVDVVVVVVIIIISTHFIILWG